MNISATPRVSIVVCSIDAKKFQQVSDNYLRLYAGQPIEIIGIHDARSLAEGYNRGIAQAKGETLILSHDDIEILTLDFAARVEQHLNNFALIGIAGTTRLTEGRWAAAGDPYVYSLISSPLPDGSGFGTMLLGGGPLVVSEIQAALTGAPACRLRERDGPIHELGGEERAETHVVRVADAGRPIVS